MMKRPSVVLLSAAVLTGVPALTHVASAGAPIQGSVSTDITHAAALAPTTLRMRGTIDKYDTATRILSLSTSKGIVQFPLASTARVRQRRDRIDAAALEKLAGYRAAIRYSESGGSKTVESVQVFGRNERTQG